MDFTKGFYIYWMRYLVFGLVVLSGYCLKLHNTKVQGVTADPAPREQEELKTGGYTSHLPNSKDIPVDRFIRSNFPELSSATLLSV